MPALRLVLDDDLPEDLFRNPDGSGRPLEVPTISKMRCWRSSWAGFAGGSEAGLSPWGGVVAVRASFLRHWWPD